jgi:nickel-type superoxide dismutase maturation protease
MAPPSNERVEGKTYHWLRRWTSPIAASTAAAAVLAMRWWRPATVEVRGGSMAPTLVAGDWALVVQARRIRVGDVVVVRSPDRPELELVKRVTAGPGDGVSEGALPPDRWWVEGDDPSASTDSRRFGAVGRSDIRARLVAVYWPPGRRRVVGRWPRASRLERIRRRAEASRRRR